MGAEEAMVRQGSNRTAPDQISDEQLWTRRFPSVEEPDRPWAVPIGHVSRCGGAGCTFIRYL